MSSVSVGSALPWRWNDPQPTSATTKRMGSPVASSASRAAGITSLPMPSPGSRQIVYGLVAHCSPAGWPGKRLCSLTERHDTTSLPHFGDPGRRRRQLIVPRLVCNTPRARSSVTVSPSSSSGQVGLEQRNAQVQGVADKRCGRSSAR